MLLTMISRWRKALLREPLIHFLLAGLAIFIFSAWRGEPVDPASRTITIGEKDVSRLTAVFAQTWQRAPRPDEIDAMIREDIKDEVYAREAIRLGLDQEDPIIRRRLRAKMEFLATSAVDAAQPEEAVLAAWLAQHREQYTVGTAFSFDHIYLGQDGAGSAQAIREAIARGADWAQAGRPLSIAASFEKTSREQIANDFGPEFADAVRKTKPGNWRGPIASGFGWHLVRVRTVTLGEPARFADVRQEVENDWRAATRAAREAKAYQTLLDSYTVQISQP